MVNVAFPLDEAFPAILSFSSTEKKYNDNEDCKREAIETDYNDIIGPSRPNPDVIDENKWKLIMLLGSYAGKDEPNGNYILNYSENEIKKIEKLGYKEKTTYLDCFDTPRLESKPVLISNGLKICSPEYNGYEKSGKKIKPCCEIYENRTWFKRFTNYAIRARYIIIFLTSGWIDSTWAFLELILYKRLLNLQSDKKLIIISDDLNLDIKYKAGIIAFLEVNVNDIIIVKLFTNDFIDNYKQILELMDLTPLLKMPSIVEVFLSQVGKETSLMQYAEQMKDLDLLAFDKSMLENVGIKKNFHQKRLLRWQQEQLLSSQAAMDAVVAKDAVGMLINDVIVKYESGDITFGDDKITLRKFICNNKKLVNIENKATADPNIIKKLVNIENKATADPNIIQGGNIPHLNPPGRQHVFKSGVNLAIILDTDKYSDIYKAVLERRNLFDLKGVPNEHPHLTLHMINFNYKHPFIKEFNILKEIKDYSKKCYHEILKGYKLKPKKFDLLGKPQDPTYVIKYKLNYPDRITKFRLCLYAKIADLIGLKDHTSFKKGLVYKLENNKKAFVYSTPDGMPLYAIHEYYHGVNNWEPHISIFKLKEKQLSTVQEIGKKLFNVSDYSKIDRKNLSKIKPFRGEPKLSFEDLILKVNIFSKIKISMIGAIKEIEYTGAKKKSRKRYSKRRKTRTKKKTRRTKINKKRKTKKK